MRYRKLDADRDMTFGSGPDNFYRDTPEAVAQAVGTRLRLISGEWFLDIAEGVPYQTNVLGTGTRQSADPTIRDAILNTEGVTGLTDYGSTFNPETRTYSITATIDTVYGAAQLNEII